MHAHQIIRQRTLLDKVHAIIGDKMKEFHRLTQQDHSAIFVVRDQQQIIGLFEQ